MKRVEPGLVVNLMLRMLWILFGKTGHDILMIRKIAIPIGRFLVGAPTRSLKYVPLL